MTQSEKIKITKRLKKNLFDRLDTLYVLYPKEKSHTPVKVDWRVKNNIWHIAKDNINYAMTIGRQRGYEKGLIKGVKEGLKDGKTKD